MAPLPDYVAGTITLTNGDTAFTGSGTGWLAAGFREGDTILGIEDNEGVVYVVETVTDNDAGTLTQPWQGMTGTYTYRMRYLSDGQRVTAQARQLIEMLGNGNLQALAGLSGTPNTLAMFTGAGAMVEVPRADLVSGVAYDVQVDTLADRDAYDGQDVGFAVLVADTGDGRSAIYSKNSATSGDWSDPAYVTGPVGPEGPQGEQGPTGDIDGVTPFWQGRITVDADAAAARAGLGAGDVSGPASAGDGHIALFDGTTGKLLKDSGLKPEDIGSVDQLFTDDLTAEFDVNGKAQARANIGIGSASDPLFLDQRVLGLIQAEASGEPIFFGGDGSALHDGFGTLDYVDVGGATNLDTSEAGVLKPTSTTDSDSSSEPNGTIDGTPYHGTTFTREFSLENGKTVTKIGLYASVAATYYLKIAKRNSSSSIDIVVSEPFVHTGDGWQDFELDTPFEVPGSGTYHLGTYFPSINNPPGNTSTSRIGGFGSGANPGVGTGISTSESTGSTAAMRAIYSTTTDNLDVTSIPVESIGTPAEISLITFVAGDEVINSDAVFSVSRDEGGNWTTATMVEMYQLTGGVRAMKATGIDVSAQPDNAFVQWRLETSNNADVVLHAVAIWGDA